MLSRAECLHRGQKIKFPRHLSFSEITSRAAHVCLHIGVTLCWLIPCFAHYRCRWLIRLCVLLMLRRSITQTTAFLLSPQTHAYTAAQNNFSLNKLLSFVSPRMSQIQISNALCSNRLYSRLSRAAAGPIQHQRLAALHNSTPWPQQHNMQLPFVPQWRSRQQTCSWQLKAELSGGGGGSSGSGKGRTIEPLRVHLP